MTQQLRHPFTLLVLALTLLLCTVAGFTKDATAAEWTPSVPVKLVVHVNPGGGADVFARFIAEIIRRERLLPVGVDVLNKSGASGAIAINFVAQKKGDATHLLGVTGFILATPLRNKELPTYRDFQPVAVMATDTNGLFVSASSAYRTIEDLLEAARKRPNLVTQGFGVWGGSTHIIGYRLGKAAGVQFASVVFKGGGEATTALLGGHVDFTAENPSEVRGYVESGKIRILAVVGDRRLSVFPGVPTLKEAGYDLGPILPTFRGFMLRQAYPRTLSTPMWPSSAK